MSVTQKSIPEFDATTGATRQPARMSRTKTVATALLLAPVLAIGVQSGGAFAATSSQTSLAELKAAYTAAHGPEGKSMMPFYCKYVKWSFTKRGTVSTTPHEAPWAMYEMPGTFYVWNRPMVANRGNTWSVKWYKCVPPHRKLNAWELPWK